jgi:DNA-binding response OmpR family regulator
MITSAVPDKKTLLIVEDDPIYAGFVSSCIADGGLPFNVHHVSTLDAGLGYIKGEAPFSDRTAYPMPAIVLLDLHLSLQHGFPLLRFLRENGYLDNEKMRVIMLTASSRAEDFQEALRLGAASYLLKSPFASTITNLLAKF